MTAAACWPCATPPARACSQCAHGRDQIVTRLTPNGRSGGAREPPRHGPRRAHAEPAGVVRGGGDRTRTRNAAPTTSHRARYPAAPPRSSRARARRPPPSRLNAFNWVMADQLLAALAAADADDTVRVVVLTGRGSGSGGGGEAAAARDVAIYRGKANQQRQLASVVPHAMPGQRTALAPTSRSARAHSTALPRPRTAAVWSPPPRFITASRRGRCALITTRSTLLT